MKRLFSILAAFALTAVLLSFDSRNVPSSSDETLKPATEMVTPVSLEVSAPDLMPGGQVAKWRSLDFKAIAQKSKAATDAKLMPAGELLRVYSKPNCVYYPCYTDWLGRRVRIVVCSENGNIDAPMIEPCPGSGGNTVIYSEKKNISDAG